MPTTFRPYEPDQLLLLRWTCASGYLAHHVGELVSRI